MSSLRLSPLFFLVRDVQIISVRYFGAQQRWQTIVFLIEDTYVELSWRIEHGHALAIEYNSMPSSLK